MRQSGKTRLLAVLLLAVMCCSTVAGQSSRRIAVSLQRKTACACGCSKTSHADDPFRQITCHLEQDHGQASATDHCVNHGKNGCGCKLKSVTIPVHMHAIMADKYEYDERLSISFASDSDMSLLNAALLCVAGHCFHKALEQSSDYQSPTISFQGPRAPPA